MSADMGMPTQTPAEPSREAVVYSSWQTARTRELLARLAGARRSVTFYPRGHMVVRDNLDGLFRAIKEFHDEGVNVPLVFFDDEVMLGEQLLASESVIFDQLIRDMQASGQTAVDFTQGLTIDELERAMQVLAADRQALLAQGGLEAAVQAADIPHVEIGTVAFAREGDEFDAGNGFDGQQSFTKALDAVRDFADRASHGRAPLVEDAREAVRGVVDNVLQDRAAMLAIAGAQGRQDYTYVHSVNVAILAVSLGSLISTNRRFLNSLGIGALMHDVGKMSPELDALNVDRELTPAEWDMIRMHPVYGAEIAAGMRGLDRAAIVAILEHHMGYDLDGYPERVPRRAQHITSRIVAIADAYDAMTAERHFAPAYRRDAALVELGRGSGTAYDPALLRLFARMLGAYPPRSFVRLSTGEAAIVASPTDDVTAPVVRIVAGADGRFVAPFDVDLSDVAAAAGRSVVACLDPAAHGIEVDEYLR